MRKTAFTGALALILLYGDAALAAVPSLAGKTFQLTGKFGGSVAVNCAIGGSHGQKIPATKNIVATITFNEDGTFSWSNDTLGLPVAVGGDWEQKGARVSLDFDDPTSVSYVKLFGEQYAVGLPGGGATFKPLQYAFKGTISPKGKLKLVESGGFRVKASAAIGGGANTCNYKLSLNRSYNGTETAP